MKPIRLLTLALAGEDYIPDLSVYPKLTIDFFEPDQIRMTDVPLMVAEIVSPTQTIPEVLAKFPIYFQAGIRSCWLVVPAVRVISVYTAPLQAQDFTAPAELHDPVLDIRIPLSQIFA